MVERAPTAAPRTVCPSLGIRLVVLLAIALASSSAFTAETTRRLGTGKVVSETIDPSILVAGETTHAAGMQLIGATSKRLPTDFFIYLPAGDVDTIDFQITTFDGHYVGSFSFDARSGAAAGWERISLPPAKDDEAQDGRDTVLREYDPKQIAFSARSTADRRGDGSKATMLLVAIEPPKASAEVATSLLVPSLAADRIYIQQMDCPAATANRCERRTTCAPVDGGQPKYFDTRCPIGIADIQGALPARWVVTRIREGQKLKPVIDVSIK